jgi:hypothetical protein
VAHDPGASRRSIPPLLGEGFREACSKARAQTRRENAQYVPALRGRYHDPTGTQEYASMQEPNSPEEVFALHKLRRADPQHFLEIVDEWLRENPRNFRAYFRRHFAWADMGEPRRALDDLNKVVELGPTPAAFCARGAI